MVMMKILQTVYLLAFMQCIHSGFASEEIREAPVVDVGVPVQEPDPYSSWLVHTLSQRVQQLYEQNRHWRGAYLRLQRENTGLRHQLALSRGTHADAELRESITDSSIGPSSDSDLPPLLPADQDTDEQSAR
mmetsp:Transcript_74785/g.118992  ORF Transcript_74785/g.118992 Transcript_74785/m.118992 type:complete len:132 (+) Transcript_74785:75-470(+)